MIKTAIFSAIAAGLLALGAVNAQSPVIVQAADAAPANSAAPVRATSAPASDTKTMLQALQAMQAMNDATIKKQEAALATLDELQKAAEELKIFSKRG
jgi:hypothetical protein